MKKFSIIILQICAVVLAWAQDGKSFNPDAVKVRLLKNKEAQLKSQLDSLDKTTFEISGATDFERWSFVKDSTRLSIRSEMVAVGLEIKELNK